MLWVGIYLKIFIWEGHLISKSTLRFHLGSTPESHSGYEKIKLKCYEDD